MFASMQSHAGDFGSLTEERPTAEELDRPVTVMTQRHFEALRPAQIDGLMALERKGEAVLIQKDGGGLIALSVMIRARAN